MLHISLCSQHCLEEMSLITDDPENSPRDCSRKRHHHGWGRKRVLIAALSTVASLAVILWLTLLRPSSPPQFFLVAATARRNKQGSDGVMIIDAAFSGRNPNGHAAALYDELQVSASYGGVPLAATLASASMELPAEGEVLISALLKSSSAPRTKQDALLRTRIEGRLRWKVGNWWVSGRHGFAVDCVAVVMPSGGVVPLQSKCRLLLS